MSIEIAEGRDVTISFNGKRCVHARRCVIGEPAVFRAAKTVRCTCMPIW
jgi:uncharacterized Fe-S cluster protein YjdI